MTTLSRVQGIPVVSVQWGPWAGTGMAASDAGMAARLLRAGVIMVTPQVRTSTSRPGAHSIVCQSQSLLYLCGRSYQPLLKTT